MVRQLLAVPNWMQRASEQKRFRKTFTLVAVYVQRWPLSTIPLWIQISASEAISPPPKNRAAWLIDKLRAFGEGRTPTGVDGAPLKWQEAILAGDYPRALECLRLRKVYIAEDQHRRRKASEAFLAALPEPDAEACPELDVAHAQVLHAWTKA